GCSQEGGGKIPGDALSQAGAIDVEAVMDKGARTVSKLLVALVAVVGLVWGALRFWQALAPPEVEILTLLKQTERDGISTQLTPLGEGILVSLKHQFDRVSV